MKSLAKRYSKRVSNDSHRARFKVIGGWLPPLTFALEAQIK
jgi:hypothetical protein